MAKLVKIIDIIKFRGQKVVKVGIMFAQNRKNRYICKLVGTVGTQN